MGIRTLYLLSLMGIAFPAEAAFRLCNRSGQTLNIGQGIFYIAIGGEKIYESRGYRVMRDGTCDEVSPYSTQRMWFRAFGEKNGVWDGSAEKSVSRTFCVVGDDSYVFDGRDIPDVHTSPSVCASRGGQLKRHFEAKGESPYVDYIVNLEKGAEPPATKPTPKPEPKPYPLPDREPVPPERTGPKETTFSPNEIY